MLKTPAIQPVPRRSVLRGPFYLIVLVDDGSIVRGKADSTPRSIRRGHLQPPQGIRWRPACSDAQDRGDPANVQVRPPYSCKVVAVVRSTIRSVGEFLADRCPADLPAPVPAWQLPGDAQGCEWPVSPR